MSGFGCVEWLAAKNFWRLRRNFFLDSPFIEPLPVLIPMESNTFCAKLARITVRVFLHPAPG